MAIRSGRDLLGWRSSRGVVFPAFSQLGVSSLLLAPSVLWWWGPRGAGWKMVRVTRTVRIVESSPVGLFSWSFARFLLTPVWQFGLFWLLLVLVAPDGVSFGTLWLSYVSPVVLTPMRMAARGIAFSPTRVRARRRLQAYATDPSFERLVAATHRLVLFDPETPGPPGWWQVGGWPMIARSLDMSLPVRSRILRVAGFDPFQHHVARCLSMLPASVTPNVLFEVLTAVMRGVSKEDPWSLTKRPLVFSTVCAGFASLADRPAAVDVALELGRTWELEADGLFEAVDAVVPAG